MNVTCTSESCPYVLNAKCVFYEGAALPYIGIVTNDNLQAAIQKIEAKISTIVTSAPVWGAIIGTVSNQTDLVTYLDGNYWPLGGTGTVDARTTINTQNFSVLIGKNISISSVTENYNFITGVDHSFSGVAGGLVQWTTVMGEAHSTINNKSGATINNASFLGGYNNNITIGSGVTGDQFGSIYSAVVIGEANQITNENIPGPLTSPMAIGYKGLVEGDVSTVMGYYGRSTIAAKGGFVHGFATTYTQFGTHTGTVERVTVGARHAINISANSELQTVGHGAYADYSAILGGIDHDIPAGSDRSVIIGGNAIKARAADPDNVYVPYLNIMSIAQDNNLIQLVARNASTGKLYYRDASSITGSFWNVSGNTNLTGAATVITGNNPLTKNIGTSTGGTDYTIDILNSTSVNNNRFVASADGGNIKLIVSGKDTDTQPGISLDGNFVKFDITSGATINAYSAVFTDTRTTPKGIQYAATGYVTDPLSLTTKEYVDALGIYTASQGLTLVGKDFRLGGTLTGGTETTITSVVGNGIRVSMGSGTGTNTSALQIAPTQAVLEFQNVSPTVTAKWLLNSSGGTYTGTMIIATVPANDDAATQVLVRDSTTGVLKYRNALSLGQGGGTGVTAIGVIDSQPKSSNGGVINVNDLVFQTADASFPGLVSTGAQTFSGEKTFLVSSGISAILRNSSATGYTSARLYNDLNSSLRALEIDYAGSTFTGALVTGGPTGESASITTTGAFPLVLGTSNTARVIISSTGNVGIGVIPTFSLDISAAAAVSRITTTGTGEVNHILKRTGGTPSEWALYTPTASTDLRFYAAGDRITFTSGGNVGIGTITPNASLQFANSTVNRKIVLFEDANNDHQFYGFGIEAAGTVRYQTAGSTTTHGHVWYAGTSSTTSSELFRIKGNGNIVQTSSVGFASTTKLQEIYNNTTLISAMFPGGQTSWTFFDTTGAKKGLLSISGDSLDTTLSFFDETFTIGVSQATGDRYDLAFNKTANTMYLYKLIGAGTGSVSPDPTNTKFGIGLETGQSVTATLQVRAGIPASILSLTNSGGIEVFNVVPAGNLTLSGTGTATDWVATSDRRIKSNISRIEYSVMDEIKRIGKLFSRYEKAGKTERGFIAQELLEVAPEYVVVPDDPEQMMAVNYSKMTALLFKGFQQLLEK